MIVSEARREANRRNAKLSTGPRTEAGQERSRQNALTHGLSAAVVRLPEDEAAIAAGAGGTPGASPLDWQGWLGAEVAVIASKLRRSERLEGRYLDRISHRAEAHWDDDRRLEAEFLGAGIARDPAAVARSLRMSPQGCDWMIERWSLLARAADRDGAWTAEQAALAFDLLGTPAEFRGGSPGEPTDLEAAPPRGFDPAGLARREVAGLLRRKAEVAPSDALDRSAARTDPDVGDDPDLRRLHRHESDLHRRLRWCVAQLEKAPTPLPAPVPPPPAPEPAPAPEPRPADAVDIELGLVERLEALMDRADAQRASDLAPRPVAPRPDPRAAREKARKADRRRKRDRRRA